MHVHEFVDLLELCFMFFLSDSLMFPRLLHRYFHVSIGNTLDGLNGINAFLFFLGQLLLTFSLSSFLLRHVIINIDKESILSLENFSKSSLSFLFLSNLLSNHSQELFEGALVHDPWVISRAAPLDEGLVGAYTPCIQLQVLVHFLFEDFGQILSLNVLLNLQVKVRSVNTF